MCIARTAWRFVSEIDGDCKKIMICTQLLLHLLHNLYCMALKVTSLVDAIYTQYTITKCSRSRVSWRTTFKSWNTHDNKVYKYKIYV